MKSLIALAIAASVMAGVAAPVQAQALIGWTNGPTGTVGSPQR